jgi:hypothetical protein
VTEQLQNFNKNKNHTFSEGGFRKLLKGAMSNKIIINRLKGLSGFQNLIGLKK